MPVMVTSRNYPNESNPTPVRNHPVIGKLSATGAYISSNEMNTLMASTWLAIGEA